MESYRVKLAKGVEEDLRQVPSHAVKRIVATTNKLASNPEPTGCVKLVRYVVEYLIRVGDYRVIYQNPRTNPCHFGARNRPLQRH